MQSLVMHLYAHRSLRKEAAPSLLMRGKAKNGRRIPVNIRVITKNIRFLKLRLGVYSVIIIFFIITLIRTLYFDIMYSF